MYKGEYNGVIIAKKVFDIESKKYRDENEKTTSFTKNDKNLFIREVEIWNKIKSHPFILQFFGASIVSKHPFIISEYCSKGTVNTYLSNENISTNEKLQIMHDIAIGFYHLHKCKIIHGDIKSDNILITDNGNPKICDFGFSIYQSER